MLINNNRINSLLMNILLIILSILLLITNAIPIAEQCPEHSQFNPCMTRCPITCSNYQNGPPDCLTICQFGCECENGFIKLTKNPWGPCVKQYECQLYTLNNKLNRLNNNNNNGTTNDYNQLRKKNRIQLREKKLKQKQRQQQQQKKEQQNQTDS